MAAALELWGAPTATVGSVFARSPDANPEVANAGGEFRLGWAIRLGKL